MNITTKDRGSAIMIRVEFKRNVPYEDSEYIDPSNPAPVITILDPQKQAKVTEAALTRKDTGRWFYDCQTGEDWPVGVYEAKTKGGDGTYTDITVNATVFRLK